MESASWSGRGDVSKSGRFPAPTYVYEMKLPDPAVPGVVHRFTFWLTYGPRDDALYVMQADHEEIEPETE